MTLSIISPASGATITGKLSVVVKTGDVSLEASVGPTRLGSASVTGMTASISIDSASLPDGPQTLMVSDGSNAIGLSVNVANTPVVSPSLLSISSPKPGDALGASFNVVGSAGSQWVNVGVWDHATMTKVGADVKPAGGSFSIPVSMGTLNGSRQLDVIAFSVPAGSSGGTQATASVSISIPAIVVPPVVTPPAASKVAFWGLGSHYVQGGIYSSRSLQQQAQDIINICGPRATCRQDAYTLSHLTTHVQKLVPGFAPVQILSCFIPDVSGTPAQAYAANYTLGQQAAAIVAGHVPMLEFGNEWNLICCTNGTGLQKSQYNQTLTAMYMAAMAGFTQGFRAADPTSQTLLGVNSTYVYFGWLDMIVNNTLPNGSGTGHLPIINDVITWHDYMTGGDMDATNAGGSPINVFDSIAALTKKPIYFSECGAGAPNQSVAAVVKYIPNQFGEMLAHPQVMGMNYYQAYDFTDGDYGVMDANGAIKQQGTALKNFTAANPR